MLRTPLLTQDSIAYSTKSMLCIEENADFKLTVRWELNVERLSYIDLRLRYNVGFLSSFPSIYLKS